MSNEPAALLDPEALAQRLKVSKATIKRMKRTGKLPRPIYLGPRMPRWNEGEINHWINSGCLSLDKWVTLLDMERKVSP